MGRLLDRVFGAALALSALGFVAIALLVLVQVGGRLADRIAPILGAEPPGMAIPSIAEIGGFLFIASVFLGLAGTLRAGGHIRVTLLTGAMPPAMARGLGAGVAALAAGLAGFATWSSAVQAWDSFSFGSVSYGMVKIPLWLPQGVMTLGLALFTLALIEAVVILTRGGTPPHQAAEAAQAEET
ncbi:TRAP transporter small permease [Rhodovulum bhavnagarense]|nr:TRAP transporter small permease [Rhodovulum bhavnagarense]